MPSITGWWGKYTMICYVQVLLLRPYVLIMVSIMLILMAGLLLQVATQ